MANKNTLKVKRNRAKRLEAYKDTSSFYVWLPGSLHDCKEFNKHRRSFEYVCKEYFGVKGFAFDVRADVEGIAACWDKPKQKTGYRYKPTVLEYPGVLPLTPDHEMWEIIRKAVIARGSNDCYCRYDEKVGYTFFFVYLVK